MFADFGVPVDGEDTALVVEAIVVRFASRRAIAPLAKTGVRVQHDEARSIGHSARNLAARAKGCHRTRHESPSRCDPLVFTSDRDGSPRLTIATDTWR